MIARPASAAERLIVALDLAEAEEAAALARALKGSVGLVKVGLELFVAAGPEGTARVAAAGLPLFLDLKLHDIPNTVAGAVRAAASLGASMLTVHAAGGEAMIAAAREAAEAATGSRPLLLAITVLTSLAGRDLDAIGLAGPPEAAVLRLARLALAAGAEGLVCSPCEVAMLRSALGPEPILVVPGVRPAGSPADDQRRTMTPREAVSAGADWLVIGRPITRSPDPLAAARAMAASLSV